jgi:hypothetical protein
MHVWDRQTILAWNPHAQIFMHVQYQHIIIGCGNSLRNIIATFAA